MKPMSKMEMQAIKGGAFSGALLTGIAAIIEGFNALITNIGGMIFAFNDPHHIKGEVHFNKTFNFSWDDTKAPHAALISNQWNSAKPISASGSNPWNFQ